MLYILHWVLQSWIYGCTPCFLDTWYRKLPQYFQFGHMVPWYYRGIKKCCTIVFPLFGHLRILTFSDWHFLPNDQCFTFYILSPILNIYGCIHKTVIFFWTLLWYQKLQYNFQFVDNVFWLAVFYPMISSLNFTFGSPILNINDVFWTPQFIIYY